VKDPKKQVEKLWRDPDWKERPWDPPTPTGFDAVALVLGWMLIAFTLAYLAYHLAGLA
jgi:hypothetical protein